MFPSVFHGTQYQCGAEWTFFFHSIFAYVKTFNSKVVLGHCDLISCFSDFAIYLDTQLVYFHTFQIMNSYDQTFDTKVLTGRCDLISQYSDFAIYIGTQYVNILLSQYVWV